jgi:hypothetical protein
MDLDAVMSDMLVEIVKTKSGAKGSRVLPLNQTMTTMANNAQLGTLSIVDGCGEISHLRADYLELTSEQRRATRAIADGKIGTLKADVLETLMRRDLIKYDGQSLVLTAIGHAMSYQFF